MREAEPMSLRGEPIETSATLPDGRTVQIRVGVPDDSYVPRKERETVDVELREDGRALAAVATLLDPDDDSEARALTRRLAEQLESGSIEPTAGAVERLVERPPEI
jgi:hypothetical protein